jgi:predicted enzyme related to lactoylglutathione lyase
MISPGPRRAIMIGQIGTGGPPDVICAFISIQLGRRRLFRLWEWVTAAFASRPLRGMRVVPLWNQLTVRSVPGEANHLSLSMRVSNAAVMHLNHLGLPVSGLRRSQQFYSAYFGFDLATAQEYEDGTVIIRNAGGFDLALHPVGQVEPSPAFLHVGFKAAEPADVRALMERMEADGVTIVERN